METKAPRITPEAEILLLCGRPIIGKDETAKLRYLISSGLNWRELFKSARNHRVVPLLNRALTANSKDLVPGDVLEDLRMANLLNAMRNLMLAKELIHIIESMEDQGVSVIPFKGPVLALLAYGDLSLRQFDDLDILISPANIEKADQLLICLGYEEEKQQGSISKAQKAAMLKYQHHHHFHSPHSKIHIEAHWTLSPELYSFHQDTANLWNRAELVDLENRKIRGLSAEDTLVLISDHAARHRWNRLAWICDVAMLLQFKSLNWEVVMDQAKEWRSMRALLLGLLLAKNLLGAPLPDEINKRIMEDQPVRNLASRAVNQLFPGGKASEESPIDPVMRNIQDQLFYIEARERFLDRARLRLRLVTTPTVEDWNLLPLPDQLFYLYYLIRPMRQAYAYRTKLFSWIFK
jgi:hypothetical protein